MTAIQATSTRIGFITFEVGLSMHDWQKDAIQPVRPAKGSLLDAVFRVIPQMGSRAIMQQ